MSSPQQFSWLNKKTRKNYPLNSAIKGRELIEAILANNLNKMVELINDPETDISYKSVLDPSFPKGATPLWAAVKMDDLFIAQMLLKRGATTRTLVNDRPIEEYVSSNDMKSLLNYYQSINKSQLRTRKAKTINFTPSNAYFISGHGEELSQNKFIVPANCVIVVKQQTGQRGYADILTAQLRQLCSMNMNAVLNPLENIEALIETFGTLAIYKPGDECPVFDYTLLACYNNNTYCSAHSSGVLDLTAINKETCINDTFEEFVHINNFKNDTEIMNYIYTLFKDSIYPSPEQLRAKFLELNHNEEFLQELVNQNSKQELFNLFIKYILDSYINISQPSLCYLFPGVYYNFVCRGMRDLTTKIYEYDPHFNKNVVRNTAYNLPEANKNIFRKKIEEAAVHRVPFLHQYYTSPRYLYSSKIKEVYESRTLTPREKIETLQNLLYTIIVHHPELTLLLVKINSLIKVIELIARIHVPMKDNPTLYKANLSNLELKKGGKRKKKTLKNSYRTHGAVTQ